MTKIKLFDNALFNRLSQEAKASQRRRKNANIHDHYDDPVQRLFITLLPDSYVRPHKHNQPEKWEFFFMVSGEVSFMVFDDKGVCEHRIELNANGPVRGVEIPYNCWHCVVPGVAEATFFEVKQGPYVAIDDKGFAQWSPEEDSHRVPEFLSKLKQLQVGQSI